MIQDSWAPGVNGFKYFLKKFLMFLASFCEASFCLANYNDSDPWALGIIMG